MRLPRKNIVMDFQRVLCAALLCRILWGVDLLPADTMPEGGLRSFPYAARGRIPAV